MAHHVHFAFLPPTLYFHFLPPSLPPSLPSSLPLSLSPSHLPPSIPPLSFFLTFPSPFLLSFLPPSPPPPPSLSLLLPLPYYSSLPPFPYSVWWLSHRVGKILLSGTCLLLRNIQQVGGSTCGTLLHNKIGQRLLSCEFTYILHILSSQMPSMDLLTMTHFPKIFLTRVCFRVGHKTGMYTV